MKHATFGRWLLTLLLIGTAAVSVLVDTRHDSHLFDDAWPPHAVFHDVALLTYLTLLCVVGVWLVWRRGPEPRKDAYLAALFCGGFWATFFIAAFFPNSSPAAHPGEPPPVSAMGTMGYPNMMIAAAAVPLSILAGWMAGGKRSEPSSTLPPG